MAESGWVAILVDQVQVIFHHLGGLGSLVRGVAQVLSAGRELTIEKGGLHTKTKEDFHRSCRLIIHTSTGEQTMSLVILEPWLETPVELLLVVVMIGGKGGQEENCRESNGLMNPDEDHLHCKDLVKSFQIEVSLRHIAGVHQMTLVGRETISGGMVGLDLPLIQIGIIHRRRRCMVAHHHQSEGRMPGLHMIDPSLNQVVCLSFKLDLQDRISPFPGSHIIPLNNRETGLQLLHYNRCRDHLSNNTHLIRKIDLLVLLSH